MVRPVPSGGPSYGAARTMAVDEFAAQLLGGLEVNGVPVNQFRAEFGPGQFQLSILPADPVTAADRQLGAPDHPRGGSDARAAGQFRSVGGGRPHRQGVAPAHLGLPRRGQLARRGRRPTG
jgi:hypothetical protein